MHIERRQGEKPMTVNEFFNVISEAAKLRIQSEKKDIYVGYLGVLRNEEEIYQRIRDKEIKHFAAEPEIRHKRWKKKTLAPPMLPNETPDYYFCDLQMTMYYTLQI